MSTGRYEHLLRFYPPTWRARYGDELVALMEDTDAHGDGLSQRRRLGIVRAGLSERLHEMGGGTDPAPVERVRSGSLLVLCGWTLFVVAGAGFAKLAEHWDTAMPRSDRWLPAGAYDTVQWAAGIGAVIVLVGAAFAVPALVRFVRYGGWPMVRRPVLRAVAVSAVAVVTTVGAIVWTHLVGPGRQGGGSPAFPVVGIVWAVLTVGALATTTTAVVIVARHLHLSSWVARLEGLLALLLTMAMVAIIGGMVVWWGSVATNAPRFLSGSGSGLFDTPAPLTTVSAGLLMLTGLALALWGDSRVVRSIRATSAG